MRWDVFCRVIDNHGDLGVCWRLAAQLAARGEQVRLWIDDARALAWMAPGGAAGVRTVHWSDPAPDLEPGEVVVEAFGCDPPPRFVERMAQRTPAPVWINLEYLSAEDYVERSHALPSPQRNGLTKWFYYPGFTPRTGGLLREPGLLDAVAAFDAAAWRRAHGVDARPGERPGERLVSLFCYANPVLPALLDRLSAAPTLLLTTPGPATEQTAAALGPTLRRGALRAQPLPWLPQADYDRLLWCCALNLVRGEDSFVRAQWAGRPFLWQIYPQHDGAHVAKLDAFLERCNAPASLRAWMRGWNGLAPLPDGAPPLAEWQSHAAAWRASQAAAPDLLTGLTGFVTSKR